jgi:hypothetical protein
MNRSRTIKRIANQIKNILASGMQRKFLIAFKNVLDLTLVIVMFMITMSKKMNKNRQKKSAASGIGLAGAIKLIRQTMGAKIDYLVHVVISVTIVELLRMMTSMICDQKILVCRTPLEVAAVREFSGKNLTISVVAVLVALKSLSAVNQFKLKGT